MNPVYDIANILKEESERTNSTLSGLVVLGENFFTNTEPADAGNCITLYMYESGEQNPVINRDELKFQFRAKDSSARNCYDKLDKILKFFVGGKPIEINNYVYIAFYGYGINLMEKNKKKQIIFTANMRVVRESKINNDNRQVL